MTTSLGAGPREEKNAPANGDTGAQTRQGPVLEKIETSKGSFFALPTHACAPASLGQMRFMDHCNGPGGEFDDGRGMNLDDQDRTRVGKENSTAGDADRPADVD